jgi:hypothetical protein
MTRRRRPGANRSVTCGPAPPLAQHMDLQHAKSRAHSGQEVSSGARPDLSNQEDPKAGCPPPSIGRWIGATVFLGILTAGSILVVVGHLTTTRLTAVNRDAFKMAESASAASNCLTAVSGTPMAVGHG